MTKGCLHRVSVLVAHRDTEIVAELIADARHWFGDDVALEVCDQVVEIAERDRFGRPIAWRVIGWVRPASSRPKVVALHDLAAALRGDRLGAGLVVNVGMEDREIHAGRGKLEQPGGLGGDQVLGDRDGVAVDLAAED